MIKVSMGIILNSERKILIARRPPEKVSEDFGNFREEKVEEGVKAQKKLSKGELKEELNVEVREITRRTSTLSLLRQVLRDRNSIHLYVIVKRDPFELNEHIEALYIGKEEFG